MMYKHHRFQQCPHVLRVYAELPVCRDVLACIWYLSTKRNQLQLLQQCTDQPIPVSA
jgi:hypothetical protein